MGFDFSYDNCNNNNKQIWEGGLHWEHITVSMFIYFRYKSNVAKQITLQNIKLNSQKLFKIEVADNDVFSCYQPCQ
jgi:hypothetical protein